jgi:hypothetical protein
LLDAADGLIISNVFTKALSAPEKNNAEKKNHTFNFYLFIRVNDSIVMIIKEKLISFGGKKRWPCHRLLVIAVIFCMCKT